MMSGNSQQDQQSLAGTASNSKSIRSSHTISHSSHSNNNNNNSINITDPQAKYISVYPKDNSPIGNTSSNYNKMRAANTSQATALIGPKPPHLVRKSSEIVRGHQRRRLERQSSLDAAAESAIVAKLLRQSTDTTATSKPLTTVALSSNGNAEKCDSFLHAQISKAGSSASSTATGNTGGNLAQAQRSNTTTLTSNALTGSSLKTTRLQRHRSSETHDERLKQQQRGSSIGAGAAPGGGIFLSIHHEHGHHHHHHRHHHSHRRGGSGGAPPIATSGSVVVLGSGVNNSDSFEVDDMELGLGGSANVVAHGSHLSGDGRMRALPSWILGE